MSFLGERFNGVSFSRFRPLNNYFRAVIAAELLVIGNLNPGLYYIGITITRSESRSTSPSEN